MGRVKSSRLLILCPDHEDKGYEPLQNRLYSEVNIDHLGLDVLISPISHTLFFSILY